MRIYANMNAYANMHAYAHIHVQTFSCTHENMQENMYTTAVPLITLKRTETQNVDLANKVGGNHLYIYIFQTE